MSCDGDLCNCVCVLTAHLRPVVKEDPDQCRMISYFVGTFLNDPSKGPQTSDCVSKYHKQVSKAAAAAASAAAAAEAAGEKIGKSYFSIVFSMNPWPKPV